jgi:phage regulator Rha-like protein
MLSIVSNSQTLTMSTREIAALLNKQHSNIKISAERLAKSGTIALQESNFNHNGNTYSEFLLEKRDCFVLVAQNSPEFTAAIVDRWQELESQQAPQLPQTFAEALQLAANQAKQLEEQAPKVAFVDNLVDKRKLMNATTIAQKHGKSAIWLNNILSKHDVYSKSVKRGKVFRQWFIDKKYGEMKQTETGHSQVMFTNAGEVWINKLLIAYGYVRGKNDSRAVH